MMSVSYQLLLKKLKQRLSYNGLNTLMDVK